MLSFHWIKILMSYACIICNLVWDTELKIIILFRNINIPYFDPCGTPQVIFLITELALLILTACFLPDK